MSQALSLSNRAVTALTDEVKRYGIEGLETGGFLMASVDGEVVSAVALAGVSGILRRPDLFQISERALDRLFTFADDHGLSIPVQFHSHRFGAHMSRTDALHGLRVEGFISTIVPSFADPPSDVAEWGWWEFRDGAWETYPPAPIQVRSLDLIVEFDADGVRER